MRRLALLLLYKQLVGYGPNDPLLNSDHPTPPIAISNAPLGGVPPRLGNAALIDNTIRAEGKGTRRIAFKCKDTTLLS